MILQKIDPIHYMDTKSLKKYQELTMDIFPDG